jgi:hypothetical protein
MRREVRDGRGSKDVRIVGQRIGNVVGFGRLLFFLFGDGAEKVDGNAAVLSMEQMYDEYRSVRHDGLGWKIWVAIRNERRGIGWASWQMTT